MEQTASMTDKYQFSSWINGLVEVLLYALPISFLFGWSYASSICVSIFGLYLISILVERRSPRFDSPMSLPVVLFLLAVFIPSVALIGPADTWREGKHILYAVGVFFIFIDWIGYRPVILRRYLFLLTGLLVFLSLDSFYQFYHGKDILRVGLTDGRSTSVFTNPNYLCFFISGAVPLPVFFLHEAKKAWIKIVYFAVLLCSFATLMLAGAKSGFVALAVFFILYLARKERESIWFFLSFGLGMLLPYFYDPIGIKGRFTAFFHHGDDRLGIWKQTLSHLIRQDFLWGKGLDTFKDLYSPVRINEIFYSFPHNFFLEIWQTSGILALLLFIYIIFKVVFLNITHLRQERICTYLFISTVMLFLTSVVSIPLFSKYVSFYFWLYFGLLTGAMKIHNSEGMAKE